MTHCYLEQTWIPLGLNIFGNIWENESTQLNKIYDKGSYILYYIISAPCVVEFGQLLCRINYGNGRTQ